MSNILVIRRKKIKMVKLYSTLIKNGLKEKTMLAVLLSPTDVRNDANYSLLVGMKIGVATMQISVQDPLKAINKSTTSCHT